jgi:predicted Fe-Mo cluster-binding NifX family protein
MKVAIASDNGSGIAMHFGRCSQFIIYDIDNKSITGKEIRKNQFTGHSQNECHGNPEHHEQGNGTHSHAGIISGLHDCQVVISHGMGWRAAEDLKQHGIQIIVTAEQDAESAIQKFLQGSLSSQPELVCGCGKH